MNETTMNQECMYQNVQAIQELNRVEGFDPRRYMRLLEGDGQNARYYLDVVYRKLWFRLRYPNGKIVKTLKKLTDQVAIVEARVYLDRNDPEDSFIANALAQKYMTGDDQFGNKYVELAETAAVGRALADAGFGLQYADLEGESDPGIVDAGLDHMNLAEGEALPEGTRMESGIAAQQLQDGEQLPGQYDLNAYIDNTLREQPSGETAGTVTESVASAMGGNIPPAMQTAPQPAPAQGRQAVPGTAVRNRPTQEPPQGGGTAPAASGQPSAQDMLSKIKKDLPAEQIYQMLNRDMAAAVVVSAGFFKGKTLGQIAIEKPQSLTWYVSDYKGPDNLLRAGARFLLDAAKAAA